MIATARFVWKLITITLTVAIVLEILLTAAVFYGNYSQKYQVAPVLTPSMEPTIPTHSAVLLVPTKAEDLRTKTIISFQPCIEGTPVTVHRIVEIPSGEGTANPIIKTKGDNNNAVDPWECRITTKPVWTVSHSVPHLGAVILFFQEKLVKTILIGLATALFVYSLFKDDNTGPKRRRFFRRSKTTEATDPDTEESKS